MTAVETMADASAVKLGDTSHRDKGWWAIDTANANAWGGAAEILNSSAADCIALQETRVLETGTKDHENSARNAGWNLAISACGFGKNGGESSGTAVGCRKHIGLSEAVEDCRLPKSCERGSLRSMWGPSARVVSSCVRGTSTTQSEFSIN